MEVIEANNSGTADGKISNSVTGHLFGAFIYCICHGIDILLRFRGLFT